MKRTLKTGNTLLKVTRQHIWRQSSCTSAMSFATNGASASAELSSKQTRDRFQGCLVGALAGDCLGAPFEGLTTSFIEQSRVEDIIGLDSEKLRNKKDSHFCFTDDSAMTRSICKSLIENKGFNASDLASKFLQEFLRDKNRGYGAGMFTIFDSWKSYGTSKNVFVPAKEHFGGSGSYGNGAAMRVAPVALFASCEADVAKLAKNTALLTHTNKHGYNGAILQALAVYKALNSTCKIDKQQFLADLIQVMSDLEEVDVSSITQRIRHGYNESDESTSQQRIRRSRREDFTFTSQLIVMDSLFAGSEAKTDRASIIEKFGNDISAQEAVVAALYSFLSNCDKSFSETLTYAVSLGGDTDTVATMACAIAGAYFGASTIPPEWKRVCEGIDDAYGFADKMFDQINSKSC